jgi:carbon monoxide dehydrogenase subunit G
LSDAPRRWPTHRGDATEIEHTFRQHRLERARTAAIHRGREQSLPPSAGDGAGQRAHSALRAPDHAHAGPAIFSKSGGLAARYIEPQGGLAMASIRKEVCIAARPETAWAALRDIGALHTRLVPGFVTATRLEDGARIVTFANGMVARELIVDIDDEARRLVWSVVGGRMTHHNGAAQVFADGADGCRFVWTADLLPNEVAPVIAAMMEQGIAVVKDTLERTERAQPER